MDENWPFGGQCAGVLPRGAIVITTPVQYRDHDDQPPKAYIFCSTASARENQSRAPVNGNEEGAVASTLGVITCLSDSHRARARRPPSER